MKVTTKKINNIKVTVRLPEKVPEAVKQSKINSLYDLLKPKRK